MKSKSPDGDRWQTWKVMAVFILAVLANQAAGIVVGKFGPATVTVDELLGRVTPTHEPSPRSAA